MTVRVCLCINVLQLHINPEAVLACMAPWANNLTSKLESGRAFSRPGELTHNPIL